MVGRGAAVLVLENVHKFIKSAEISVDAATKDTYENYTRLGGKWEDIQHNLRFIATLPNLEYVTMSFVVQNANYKEMEMFYKMSEEILTIHISIGRYFLIELLIGEHIKVMHLKLLMWVIPNTQTIKK